MHDLAPKERYDKQTVQSSVSWKILDFLPLAKLNEVDVLGNLTTVQGDSDPLLFSISTLLGILLPLP